jgi:hypothetical protein
VIRRERLGEGGRPVCDQQLRTQPSSRVPPLVRNRSRTVARSFSSSRRICSRGRHRVSRDGKRDAECF